MLIAIELLRMGTPVLFGQQWSMFVSYPISPLGVIVYSTVNKIQGKTMRAAKRIGHVVIGFDQEALPFSGAGFLDNVDPLSVQNSDLFLVATDAHKTALSAVYPDLAIEVVGNPRVDILRKAKPPCPMDEPYVLFNTSFALTNSVWQSTEKAVSVLLSGGGVSEQTVQERLDFEIASKNEMMPLLEWAAANLPWRVVVRPHPAEDVKTWNEFARDRMTIVAGQSPTPWIAHAKLMVHANSTTGLEAAFLGTPCLNISPEGYDNFADLYVLRRTNTTARTAQKAAEIILDWSISGKGLSSAVAMDAYPEDSGRRIAEVAQRYVASQPIAAKFGIRTAQRNDTQKAKFTVSLEEVMNCFNALNVAARGVHVRELDDSLFYLATQ